MQNTLCWNLKLTNKWPILSKWSTHYLSHTSKARTTSPPQDYTYFVVHVLKAKQLRSTSMHSRLSDKTRGCMCGTSFSFKHGQGQWWNRQSEERHIFAGQSKASFCNIYLWEDLRLKPGGRYYILLILLLSFRTAVTLFQTITTFFAIRKAHAKWAVRKDKEGKNRNCNGSFNGSV